MKYTLFFIFVSCAAFSTRIEVLSEDEFMVQCLDDFSRCTKKAIKYCKEKKFTPSDSVITESDIRRTEYDPLPGEYAKLKIINFTCE